MPASVAVRSGALGLLGVLALLLAAFLVGGHRATEAVAAVGTASCCARSLDQDLSTPSLAATSVRIDSAGASAELSSPTSCCCRDDDEAASPGCGCCPVTGRVVPLPSSASACCACGPEAPALDVPPTNDLPPTAVPPKRAAHRLPRPAPEASSWQRVPYATPSLRVDLPPPRAIA